MNLIRFTGRALLGGYFVANGASSLSNPEPYVERTEPLAERFVPLVKDAAPEQVAGFIPTDASTLVRLNGGLQLLGGLALITGIGRRFGATLISAAMIPHAIAARPTSEASRQEKEQGRADLIKNLALLGGALLASQDLAGKPSMAWRAEHKRKELEKSANELGRKATKKARKLEKRAAKLEKQAARKADVWAKQVEEVLPL